MKYYRFVTEEYFPFPRRAMQRIAAALAMLAFLACGKVPVPELLLSSEPELAIARGIVFDDHNRNAVRDEDEPGIGGVKVSNGVDVVRTDARGRYAVPLVGDGIVYVVKPRDWMTPTDANHLPHFYYIHRPLGSPDHDFRYKGLAPTGSLPESVDFPLYRTTEPEPDRFDVIVFADPQPYTREEISWFARDTVAELIGTDAAFGISLGDLVGNDLDLFEPLNEVQALVGIPWYNVQGNHDMNFMSPDDAHADETFESVYGPSTYAFQYGPVHFVVLDDVVWKGFTGYRKRDGFPITRNYEGGLRDDQLEFLRNYVATVPTDELIVLSMHIPLEGNGIHRVPQKDRLFEILANHLHTFSMSGHTHYQKHWFFHLPGGGEHHHFNVGTASGSWYCGAPDEVGIPHTTMRDGTPNGYSIVTFDGTDYSIRFKASRWSGDYQMNIHALDRVAVEESTDSVEVLVNVFAGSEKSIVEMRIGKSTQWVPLERVERKDPFYLWLKALEEEDRPVAWRNLPKAEVSSHLWAGELPADLAKGTYLIEIQTTDMFGQKYQGRRPLRVE